MNRIRPWLYIGKVHDTLNPALLRANGIGAMLQLAKPVEQPGITSLYLPVEDFRPILPDLLRQGIDFVRAQKRRDLPVLVACGAGINRSAAFSIAVLKEEEGLGLLEAYQEVRRCRPVALPVPPTWASLCDFYGESIAFELLFTRPDRAGEADQAQE